MKKTLFILAALAGVALVGCNKDIVPNSGKESIRAAEVTFSISTKGTKADPVTTAKTADENMVNTVDLFVFNADRQLDAYGRWTAAVDPDEPAAGEFKVVAGVATNEVDNLFSNRLSCTTGDGKKVYAVLNSEFTDEYLGANITNESALQALVYTLAANKINRSATEEPDWQLNNFEMIGFSGANFHAGNNDVSISVNALVARVEIKKITKAFKSAAQQGALTIKGIYMTNVVASTGFADASSALTPRYLNSIADPWYNVYGYDDEAVASEAWPYKGRIQHITDLDPWEAADGFDTAEDIHLRRVFGDAGAGYALAENNTLNADGTAVGAEGNHSVVFYVMPNQVPWGTGTPAAFGPMAGTGAWSPRHTKMVVEVEYAGARYYYPIPIAKNGVYPMGDASDNGTGYEGIVSNFSYEIDELVLTRLGSRNPDECVLPADVKFNISVNAWTQQLIQTETGKYVI